jgi:hypothetical protein
MLLAVRIESERARATAAAVDAWRREQQDDPALSEVEDAAHSALSTLPLLRDLVGKAFAQAATGTLEDGEHTWQALVHMIDTCKETLIGIRDLARKAAEREGAPFQAVAELDAAVEELTRLGQAAYDAWPQDDPAEMTAAREYARQALSNEKLLKLAKDHPPPQSWYDEGGKNSRPAATEE